MKLHVFSKQAALLPLLLLSLSTGCRPKQCPTCGKAKPQATSTPIAGQTNPGHNSAAPLPIEFPAPPPFVSAPIGGLKRGVNLGNGFDAPSEGAWGVILGEKHFEMAKAAGFDHVRLPVRFSAHALPGAPYTIDEDFFKRIDWALDQAQKNGLIVLLDLHHYEELMENPDAHVERLLGLWSQIAERYKDRPETVLFELMNEPCKKLDPERINKIYEKLIPLVRKSNPTRTVLVEGFFWSAPSYMKNLVLPKDPNLVVSFHMYQPILFTHQGAPWMDPEFRSTGIVFPGPPQGPTAKSPEASSTQWTRDWLRNHEKMPAGKNPSGPAAVAAEFDMASRYAQNSGFRIHLGEFGAIDFGDATSRENYYRIVRLEAERRGIPWTVWDDGGNMKLLNVHTGKYTAPVAKGLFTAQPGDAMPANVPVE